MVAKSLPPDIQKYVDAIRDSGLTIYDDIPVGDPMLWIPTPTLERLLEVRLGGMSLNGLPLRTRSKLVKTQVCEALGYPIPKSFKKTSPRFPGQDFDIYIQQSNNLQIWNQEITQTRRYAMIRPDSDAIIARVKVVSGDSLSILDTTGTLTQKHQARCTPGASAHELHATRDTATLVPIVHSSVHLGIHSSPADAPNANQLLSILSIYEKLRSLIGRSFPDAGSSRDRNRGDELHRLASSALGYSQHRDNGQHPDIPHQLLEVKLQTSVTIDLGLVEPTSKDSLGMLKIGDKTICHSDIRYAVFCAKTDGDRVTITNLIVTTGESFFERFPRFGGKVVNKKIQIPLPRDFFN